MFHGKMADVNKKDELNDTFYKSNKIILRLKKSDTDDPIHL